MPSAAASHVNVAARRRPFSTSSLDLGRPLQQPSDRGGRPGHVVGIEEQRGVRRDLGQRARVAAGDRQTAGHRLEHGQAEALHPRRQREAAGQPVEALQVGGVEPCGQAQPVIDPQPARQGLELVLVGRPGAGQHQPGAAEDVLGQRPDQQLLVLVRPLLGHAQDHGRVVPQPETATQLMLRGERDIEVDPDAVGNDVDPVAIEAQVALQVERGRLGACQQPVGAGRRQADHPLHAPHGVGRAPGLGHAEPDRVVQGDHRGRPRDPHGSGVRRSVDHVEPAQRGRERNHAELRQQMQRRARGTHRHARVADTLQPRRRTPAPREHRGR